MLTLTTHINTLGYTGTKIDSVRYAGRPAFKSKLSFIADGSVMTPSGKILHRQKGFSFMLEPPFVSFKTYRAMCNYGMKETADDVISNKARSWITPDFLWDGMAQYLNKAVARTTNVFYHDALDELRLEFKVTEKVPLLSFDDAILKIPQGTSPGLPYIQTHPGKTKGDILKYKSKSIYGYWDRVGMNKPVFTLPDCAAFARSHISSPGENKVRPVWAYPIQVISAEAMFSYPILDGLVSQKIGHHTAYGMEMMKGGMAWLHSQLLKLKSKSKHAKILLTDFSRFDSTVPAWIIRDCFQIIKEKLDFSRISKNNEIYVQPPEYGIRIFNKLVNYFINTPIRNIDGRRLEKDHGIPSGSMFTNIIGTMVNFLVSRTLYKTLIGKAYFDVYFGDDALIAFPEHCIINVDDLAKCCLDTFGMIINTKKSYWTSNYNNVHFLGYYNHKGSCYKPTRELIASMLMPQYFKDDWEYNVSRALGCLLAGGGANLEVFMAAQAVYLSSALHEGAGQRGIELIKKNPRMKRHLAILGLEDIVLHPGFFLDHTLSVPANNCTKFEQNIDIIDW